MGDRQRRRRQRHNGGTTSRGVRTVLLGVGLFLVLTVVSQKPDVAGLGLFALVAALLVATAWWQTRESVHSLRRRTCLAIAALLSDGRPRDRREISAALRRVIPSLNYPPLRWLHVEDQSLEEMSQRGLLVLHNGRHAIKPPTRA